MVSERGPKTSDERLPAGEGLALPKRPAPLSLAWRFVRRKPLGAFGLLIILIMVGMTLGSPSWRGIESPVEGRGSFPWIGLNSGWVDHPIGFALGDPWLARYDAEKVFRNEEGRIDQLQGPSGAHWFGTDRSGHDIYSRVVWGARRSLFLGLGALTMATVVGTFIAVVSAYFRGWLDTVIQRFMDAIQVFPALLVLLLAVSLSEPSMRTLAIALGVVGVTAVQRIVRGVVLSVREQPYVDAARVLGASDGRIMLFHILPNVSAPIIVAFSVGLGAVILAEAALAFIVPSAVPPGPAWGIMLNTGMRFTDFVAHPAEALFSAAAIALAVTGFNLAGDALRDVLDPRLRLG